MPTFQLLANMKQVLRDSALTRPLPRVYLIYGMDYGMDRWNGLHDGMEYQLTKTYVYRCVMRNL